MVQIDNQKIGAFITAKRKEGNMTQKELGGKLYKALFFNPISNYLT